MKQYSKWRITFYLLLTLTLLAALYFALRGQWLSFAILFIMAAFYFLLFFSFWRKLHQRGIETEVKISRVLGKDAKDALSIGEIGLITYNDEYEATWMSDYLVQFFPNLINHKLTNAMPFVRDLFRSDVDMVTGTCNGNTFEVTHKEGSQVLYVRNITELTQCRTKMNRRNLVVGVINLDNYTEYLSYDNEELLNEINNRIRTPLLAWGRKYKIMMRRTRSDRYLLILDSGILNEIWKDNFSILQQIKDSANRANLSITISAAFVSDQDNFLEMDRQLNELGELVQSRGGDQIALKRGSDPVEFIGGNSEKASQRSKTRVRVVGSSIQDVVRDSRNVFILGHVNTDYDAMGAALAASNWARALGAIPHIVLKDVPRDGQLQATMDAYARQLNTRHHFITEDQALEMINPQKDLIMMVDHSNPAISSGSRLLREDARKIVIDHHRRNGNSGQDNVLVSYIESKASSTCELMTELIESSTVSVPIYEMEATIMYLGIIVDTGRFKQHTSERTFEAAARLRSWGANSEKAEKALQVDYADYRRREHLIDQAKVYKKRFLVDVLNEPLSRTMMSTISDALLGFKGCQAAFTIGINETNGNVAVSARSDGTINVQKIMEKMNGGGHFSAAALERSSTTVQAVAAELESLLDQEGEE